jgi:hypothetical protein
MYYSGLLACNRKNWKMGVKWYEKYIQAVELQTQTNEEQEETIPSCQSQNFFNSGHCTKTLGFYEDKLETFGYACPEFVHEVYALLGDMYRV